jgi:hypothetical protein
MRIARICIINILLVFLLFAHSIGKEIVNIHLGVSYLPENDLVYEYDYFTNRVGHVNPTGILFGFSIPVNVDFMEIHLKIAKAYHSVDKLEYLTSQSRSRISPDKSIYTYNVNEILVGKSIKISHSYNLLPQVGLGYSSENLVGSEQYTGFGDKFWFVASSILLQKKFKNYSAGYMLHVERAVHDYDGSNILQSVKVKSGLVVSF